MDLRDLQRTHLKGIVVAIFDDIEGPKVVFNDCLAEENALLLAIQGQTVSGMGRIEEYTVGFMDPLNVPNRDGNFASATFSTSFSSVISYPSHAYF